MTKKDILSMNWGTLCGKAKARWFSLTNDDLRRIDGNYDVLVTMLQKRYFYSRAAAERDANDFLNNFEMNDSRVHA